MLDIAPNKEIERFPRMLLWGGEEEYGVFRAFSGRREIPVCVARGYSGVFRRAWDGGSQRAAFEGAHARAVRGGRGRICRTWAPC